MSDISSILNIGLSGLRASKTGIEVTAQNIANVDTPGYSQKEVVLGPKEVTGGSPYFFNGVEVSEIKRVYDEELARQISIQEGKTGYWQTTKEYMGRIEDIFNESGQTGLSSDLDAFWNAWQKLSTNPNGYGERQEVVAMGAQLSESFSSRAEDLQKVMADVNEEISTTMDEINEALSQIAEINRQMGDAIGGKVDEYKDELDRVVQGLSQQVNVNYWQDRNGQVMVSLNGHTLVEGTHAFSLSSSTDDQGQAIVQMEFSDGTLFDVTDQINSGKVQGLLELSNKTIPGYLEKLDKLASTLSEKVNEQHLTGYGLDGSTDINFFNPPDSVQDAARNLALNPELESNLDLIAASSSADVPDNENALKMLDLQMNQIIEDGGQILKASDYYANFNRTIGRDTQGASTNKDRQQAILNNLKDRRSVISDVAMDEQLANLIKFQQTYNASAKIVSTADEMMTTLLNISA
ncbi:MAG: flagellar hook-associated protein FlgK [bacterium]